MKDAEIGVPAGISLEYELALLRLNDLQTRDEDESPEGESLRDEMERLFWRLSDAEKERLGGLSADLYMLQDDEIFEARAEGETDAGLERELRVAWERKEWDVALGLLRKNLASLTTETLAVLRAYAYDQLGLHPSAQRFQQKAAELTLERWYTFSNAENHPVNA